VELHNSLSTPNIIRMIKSKRLRWARQVGRKGRTESTILVKKGQGMTSLGRHRRRWDDIKMDLRYTGWSGMDWINLAQDMDQWRALAKTVTNLCIP
jgi:hypothetical protein